MKYLLGIIKGLIYLATSVPRTHQRVLYPKVFMVQAYADTLISKSEFHNMGPIHPLLNLSFFILLIMILILGRFNRKEI